MDLSVSTLARPLADEGVPTKGLTETEQDLLEKRLRWYLRGLKPNYTIKKARVDGEITANYAKKGVKLTQIML